jgi:ElaB/YqjD/DUF883 family membrane-anchored ribosome-binding protein
MTAKRSDIGKQQLHQEFNAVVTETEQLLKSLATAGNDKAGALRDGAVEGFAAAGERLDQLRLRALDQAKAAGEATHDYVRGNPWRAIGIAAGVCALTGLVAGLLIARK